MVILSGIQPSGSPHIGNYFGMMRPAIGLQRRGTAYFFIADYHALTSLDDPKELPARVLDVALDFLACGLDPDLCVFFKQSDVPEVNELAWFLSTVTPMGLLERCHGYKDKTARGFSPNHGLFAYPVLMAADILLYDADLVPVGKDQKQHLEVTRDIASKFNDKFGETFKLPEIEIRSDAAIVPGTDGQKMSKSYGNIIEMFAPEKQLRKKIMSIVTDCTPVEQPKPTENSAILQIAKCLASPQEYEIIEQSMQAGGTGYGDYKKQLFEMVWTYFEPHRKKREELLRDPGHIRDILKKGGEKAREKASATLRKTRTATGIA